ncbi:MAG: hypothetical protein ABI467_29540 [Kofleriaceae bacterium]
MAIEVQTSDPSIARVELVLVQSACATCTGDAPPGWPLSMPAPAGPVYYQVPGDRFTANVDGGVAGFTLEPGSDDYLLRLVAIGFDRQGTAKGIVFVDRDFHIKQHLGEVVQLELAARDDSVIVWRAPSAPDTAQSCVAVLGATNDFVVPPDDPDCDGVTGAAECDAFWYEYAKPANTTVPQYCVEQPSADQPCMIGTETGCVDGVSQAGCAPGNVCVPARACIDCTDPSLVECANHVGTDPAPGVARVHCVVPLVGAVGNYASCTAGTAPINLDAQFGSNGSCSPGLLPANAPLPVMPVPSLATDTGQGPATFLVSALVPSCQFTLLVMASVSAVPPRSVPGLVVLHGPTHTIVMPLVVDYTSTGATACAGVATAPTCTVDTSSFTDPMWSCAVH